MELALAIGFALFIWWFSTGAILYLDGLPRRTFPWSLAAITAVAVAGFAGAAASASDTTVFGAYLGFVSGLAVWAWHETTFLLGYVTGPRQEPCTAMRLGWERVSQAIATILHHELAILVAALLLWMVTADGTNRTALWTFLILWGNAPERQAQPVSRGPQPRRGMAARTSTLHRQLSVCAGR